MVLFRYLKAPKDGLLDPRGSLANEIPSCTIEQANHVGSLSQMRWCPYILVMVVITNTTVQLSKTTIHKHA